jgi:peptidoglycan/LPS O-acetylase OafA/YrhL
MGEQGFSDRSIQLPGLNALRFYAAFSVLVGHICNNFGELRTQVSSFPLLNAFLLDPQSAVNLFFVLSGFLITYLLLREKSQNGKISVRKFYLRRILRIWPLYYSVLFICTFLLPFVLGPSYSLYSFPFSKEILLITMLPNFVGELGPLSHLWSIGLEEQYYLSWPWVVKHEDNFQKIALGIVLVKIMITPVIMILGNSAITNLFLTLRFECMAIGAMGAYFYYCQHPLMKTICSIPGKLVVCLGMIYLATQDVPLTEPVVLIVSVLFLMLIINIVSNKQIGQAFDHPWLDRLGKVSYGIYMFHYPIVYLVIFTLYTYHIPEGLTYTEILYSAAITITLGLAFASYYLFERPFLRLKDRFAATSLPR